jgi:putative salt-induced outer membrane protein YdiY
LFDGFEYQASATGGAGYAITHNTNPYGTPKKLDTGASVNLVFSF